MVEEFKLVVMDKDEFDCRDKSTKMAHLRFLQNHFSKTRKKIIHFLIELSSKRRKIQMETLKHEFNQWVSRIMSSGIDKVSNSTAVLWRFPAMKKTNC